MSGGEPAIGPGLPERVEQVRAALPDADRARFEQDLDQALDMAGSTRDLGPLAMLSRAGGEWWLFASTAVGDGRRPRARLRRGDEPEWDSEPLDVEDAISRYLT